MSNKGFNDNQQSLIRKSCELSYSGHNPFGVPYGSAIHEVSGSGDTMVIINMDSMKPLEGVEFEQFKAIAQEVIDKYPQMILTPQDIQDIRQTADFMIYHGSPLEVDNSLAPSSYAITLESGDKVELTWATYDWERLPRLTANLRYTDFRDASQKEMQVQSLLNDANLAYLRAYVAENRCLELSYRDCMRLYRLGFVCVLVADCGQVTIDGNEQSELAYLVEVHQTSQEMVARTCIIDRLSWRDFLVQKSRRI